MNPDIKHIIYNLSEKTSGTSDKLFEFFKLNKASYEAIYPLTHLQEDIILDIRINPDTRAYNMIQYFHTTKELDISLWEQLVEEYIAINPTFRTVFVERDSVFCQAVGKQTKGQFEFIDLSAQDLSEEAIANYIENMRCKPYDYENEYLFKHFIIKRADADFFIGLRGHQLITDAIGAQFYYKDLLSAYEQRMAGKNVALQSNTFFHEYINRNIHKFDTDDNTHYWREALTAFETIRYPENSGALSGKETQELEFHQDDIDKIKAYCWEHKITIPFFLKIVYSLVVNYIYSCKNNFILYENINDRPGNQSDASGVFLFVSINNIDSSVLTNSAFSELYDYFRKEKQSKKRFRYVSFRKLNELVNDLGIRPMFNYVRRVPICFYDEEIDFQQFDDGDDKEVYLFCEERSDSIHLTLNYNRVMLTDPKFLERFQYLVRQIAAGDKLAVQELDFTLKQEKDFLLHSFNNTSKATDDVTFPELITEHCAKAGDKIAVQCGSETLSYRQLDNHSGNLATSLLGKYNIQPEEPVGILMQRNVLFPSCIVGIMKAGATYMPIDPKSPVDRTLKIIKEARCRIIITDEHLSGHEDIDLINPYEYAKDSISDRVRLANPSPDSSAYVIFTSGSTGDPKGAIIEHRGFVNHVVSKIETFNITPDSHIAQNAPQAFDVSVWQLLTPLAAGATVHIYSDETVHSLEEFSSGLLADRINILEVVPSYLQVLLPYLQDNEIALPNLEFLLVTGEQSSLALIQQAQNYFPKVKIVNAYGPAEASDDIALHFFESDFTSLRIPVGKPIQNVRICILNEQQQLLPPGIVGEICVAGVAVGRGYLYDPVKTNAVFGKDVIWNTNDRLYKTGDLGWIDEQGLLYFIGRKDHQVKIRGHRIELGEIEAVLNQDQRIKEAVVTRVETDNDAHLCAYVVMCDDYDEHTLKLHLKDKLPEYMVPSFFVKLDQLPLNTNGKVDRKLLPAPDSKEREFIAPGTDLEKLLATAWAEVLEIPESQISVTDDFFELGGHSITAIKLVSNLEKQGVSLAINKIFIHTTVQSMAAFLSQDEEGERIVDFKGAENTIRDAFNLENRFIQYRLSSNEERIILYVEDESIVNNESLIRFIDEKLDENLQPDFIKASQAISEFGNQTIEINEKDFYKIID